GAGPPCRSTTDSGLDQPPGVLARPFGWAVHAGEQAALRVEEKRHGQAQRQRPALQVVEDAHRRVAVEAERLHSDLRQEGLRLRIASRVDVDGDDFEGIAAHLLLQRRSEEHTSELQSRENLVCRLLLEEKK